MPKWRKPKFAGFHHTPPDRRAALNEAKDRIAQLLEREQFDKALAQLEELVANYPNDADLQMMLGMGHLGMDEPDTALLHYERAYALSKQPEFLYPLGLIYLEFAMFGSALYAFTESIRRGLPLPDEMQPTLTYLRQRAADVAGRLRLPLDKTIAGLREMERSMRWLDRADYRRAIEASRAAINVLGAWPPPHNNLALAFFFDGQPAQAIAESRQILARDPENLMAAGNLVRFLAWGGERAAAEEVWRSLRTRDPLNLPDDALKLAEAAAILDDDESVRRVLLPLEGWEPEQFGDERFYLQVQRFLATADANLGNPKAAKRRLRALGDDNPNVQALSKALRDGQKGFGLVGRFTYFRSVEVLPLARLEEFVELVDAAEGDAPKASKKLKEFAACFPQVVVLGEKLIWEENAVAPGISFLRWVGTPSAHAALRRFAGSQAGSDDDRMQALVALQTSGGVQPGEMFTFWHGGTWRDIQVHSFRIGPRDEQPFYKANAAKLMGEGVLAMRAKQWDEAITLLRKVVELEPKAYEAFNNLAAALDASGDHKAAIAMLERALAIKPDYVHARANLAIKLVNEDVDAADAMLAPLQEQMDFTTGEFTHYQYALAQVALARKEFDAACDFLQMALDVDPEYELGEKLLRHVDAIEFSQHKGNLWERLYDLTVGRRDRYRDRQRAKLATLTPSLVDMVGLYTAEVLHVIAKAVAPLRQSSNLRKAELQRLVRETLLDPASLRSVVERLSKTERTALAAVLAAGGAMQQAAFGAAYGDDADESPWWNYHPPQSVAGRLRLHGLLVETTVKKRFIWSCPSSCVRRWPRR